MISYPQRLFCVDSTHTDVSRVTQGDLHIVFFVEPDNLRGDATEHHCVADEVKELGTQVCMTNVLLFVFVANLLWVLVYDRGMGCIPAVRETSYPVGRIRIQAESDGSSSAPLLYRGNRPLGTWGPEFSDRRRPYKQGCGMTHIHRAPFHPRKYSVLHTSFVQFATPLI